MCRLFESIRLENGVFSMPGLHEARMEKSLRELFNLRITHRLNAIEIPQECQAGLYKCRIVYRDSIEAVEFIPYRLKTITSVRLVTANDLEYAYKYNNREAFQKLSALHQDVDELLLEKQGQLTDSTYSNLAFFNGHQWHTPVTPLLEGTRRQALLDGGKIVAREILAGELGQYFLVSFINAMTDLGEVVFPVNKILQD